MNRRQAIFSVVAALAASPSAIKAAARDSRLEPDGSYIIYPQRPLVGRLDLADCWLEGKAIDGWQSEVWLCFRDDSGRVVRRVIYRRRRPLDRGQTT